MGEMILAQTAIALLGLFAAGFSWAVSRLLARRRYLLDRPTARSNHRDLTPRSGGVALILAFCATLGLAIPLGLAPLPFALGLVAVAFLAFAVGFADDVIGLAALWKLAGQVAAAGLFIVLFGALQSGPVPLFGELDLGAAGLALAFVWIIGFMNAFNFMDGVNGIAAACGAFALAGLAAASAAAGAPAAALAAMLAAAALIGFLPINFPRGRLFMGDGGSQAFGLIIAGLAIAAANESGGQVSALFMPTAMAPFLFDVAFTLAHRARRRRNLFTAHSEHLYQLLVRSGGSHSRATTIFLTLTAASTAFALALPAIDPAWRWLAPTVLALVFAGPALRLYARARAAGMLEPSGRREATAREEPAPLRHAAE